ncbi:hypothetical protein P691DRAFT_767528 [Macrolepiota fuliginosa MF-IS2]|uniref:Uncharacterized protein n=1 Tax=Macrolepiota fuliginosa MF-IS2 TaxID=1400762 RepID=A0A9P5WZB0_9AGAR|nr:hypothetical protein P691DRAFT_767528 [Macrolepiota fuliginosa MF-IS2]
MPCTHIHSCINCGNKHATDDHCCPYWWHHFNRSWIWDQAIWDASACKGIPPPPIPNTPHGPKMPLHDCMLHPPQQDTNQPSLPPIHEDNEEDDDEMEPFRLGLDDDYEFHK